MGRPYKVIIKNNSGVIDVRSFKSLWLAVFHTLSCLEVLNGLDCADCGEFKTTANPFNGDLLIKRYIITINAPYTVFEIKKQAKGSLNQELFIETLKNIKGEYFERI